MAFVFRLEKLLKLRERLRDERGLALAQAERAVQIIDSQLVELASERAENREAARKSQLGGPLEVDRLLDSHRYELMLSGQERHLRQQRERVALEVARRRAALVEADRQVKSLEKLREKQSLAHEREEQRKETNDLDEIAQRRAASW
jgi:flagellar FliJ protein